LARVTSAPPKLTVPLVGVSSLAIIFAVVDFPLPDSPTIASVRPASTSKLTESTARSVFFSPVSAFPCRTV
jgi:hypothetical protein